VNVAALPRAILLSPQRRHPLQVAKPPPSTLARFALMRARRPSASVVRRARPLLAGSRSIPAANRRGRLACPELQTLQARARLRSWGLLPRQSLQDGGFRSNGTPASSAKSSSGLPPSEPAARTWSGMRSLRGTGAGMVPFGRNRRVAEQNSVARSRLARYLS
jgi:hypothetical protein